MVVVMIACGSRGDVEPVLALAMHLSTAGSCVRFVSHNEHRGLVSSMRSKFLSVEASSRLDFHPLSSLPASIWGQKCVVC